VVGLDGRAMDEPIDAVFLVHAGEEVAGLGADFDGGVEVSEGALHEGGFGVGAEDLVADFGAKDGERADASAHDAREIYMHIYIIAVVGII